MNMEKRLVRLERSNRRRYRLFIANRYCRLRRRLRYRFPEKVILDNVRKKHQVREMVKTEVV